jgi:hypothetical protein
VQVSPDAPLGTYPLLNTDAAYAPPDGRDLPAIGVNGVIRVHGDAGCDARLTVAALFDGPTPCDPDCNLDGEVSAADVACVAAQLGSSH